MWLLLSFGFLVIVHLITSRGYCAYVQYVSVVTVSRVSSKLLWGWLPSPGYCESDCGLVAELRICDNF